MLNLLAKQDTLTRFTNLILFSAIREKATKIVFGDPSEEGANRVLRDPSLESAANTPWDAEDRERFSGQSDAAREEKKRQEERKLQIGIGPTVPLWFKVGNAYKEQSPIPGYTLIEMIKLLQSWNRRQLIQKRTKWEVTSDPEIWEEQCLSTFAIQYEGERMILASLGFEPNYCFSISICYSIRYS